MKSIADRPQNGRDGGPSPSVAEQEKVGGQGTAAPYPWRLSENPVLRNKGFTLLEVIMTLAIVGLIAVATVPFMFSAVDPVDTAAEDIRTLSRSLRSEALLSGEPKHMVVSNSGLAIKGEERVAQVPEGWALEIRRTGETKFRKPLKGEIWEFNGEGICEPIVLRMVGDGRTYEVAFDPLTALEPPESLP